MLWNDGKQWGWTVPLTAPHVKHPFIINMQSGLQLLMLRSHVIIKWLFINSSLHRQASIQWARWINQSSNLRSACPTDEWKGNVRAAAGNTVFNNGGENLRWHGPTFNSTETKFARRHGDVFLISVWEYICANDVIVFLVEEHPVDQTRYKKTWFEVFQLLQFHIYANNSGM